jgi:hypothetical protein
MLVGSFALCASPARSAAPTVLACEGTLETGTFGEISSSAYYRITPTALAEWDKAKRVWEDDLCGRKQYVCFLKPTSYSADGAFTSEGGEHVRHILSIDRTTGKVKEAWNVRFGDSMLFNGDCKPAADPALATGPTKF